MKKKVEETVKVKPSGIPYRCVICNGFGTVSNQHIVCHGCEGKGYILVPTEEVKNGK